MTPTTTEPAVVGGDPTPITNPVYSDHGTIVPSNLPAPRAPRSNGVLAKTGVDDLLWSLRWWMVALVIIGLALWAASNLWRLRQERKRKEAERQAMRTSWGQEMARAMEVR
jgi:hypothetical protein